MVKKIFVSLLIFLASLGTAYAYDMNSAVGNWIYINDYSDQSTMVVKIWQQAGTLYGKVVRIIPGAGRSSKDVCVQCEGDLKNKPILGMTILWGFTQDQDGYWANGKLLDPYSGKISERKINLINEGHQLQFHSLWRLTRHTQTWVRLN